MYNLNFIELNNEGDHYQQIFYLNRKIKGSLHEFIPLSIIPLAIYMNLKFVDLSDVKSDLWSLGCILYEIIELKKAFPIKFSELEIVKKISQVSFNFNKEYSKFSANIVHGNPTATMIFLLLLQSFLYQNLQVESLRQVGDDKCIIFKFLFRNIALFCFS